MNQDDIGARFRQHVGTYCTRFRHPDLPPFKIHDLHEMKTWWKTDESARAGCYAFYDQQGGLLYIGKASMGASLGSRLANHDRSKKTQLKWRELAVYVQLVTVHEAFEAPSLEEYLIREMQPLFNERGIMRIKKMISKQ